MFAAEDRLTDDAVYPRRPGGSDGPAPISSNLRQYSERRSLVFSRLRTLFPAHGFQFLYCQSLPHSLQQERKLTPAFPITPGLFLRPFTQERKSSPVFSCACARFCRNGRYHKKFVPHIDGQPISVDYRQNAHPQRSSEESHALNKISALQRRANATPASSLPLATRALYSLFGLLCIRASANFSALNRLRTLWKNHPGGGGSTPKISVGADASAGKVFVWQRAPSSATIAPMPDEQKATRNSAGDKRVWALLGATQ